MSFDMGDGWTSFTEMLGFFPMENAGLHQKKPTLNSFQRKKLEIILYCGLFYVEGI